MLTTFQGPRESIWNDVKMVRSNPIHHPEPEKRAYAHRAISFKTTKGPRTSLLMYSLKKELGLKRLA